MAVQQQDRAYILDCLAVLNEFHGPTAENFTNVAQAMLVDNPSPTQGQIADERDVGQFHDICQQKLEESRTQLAEFAVQTTFEDCASTAILLGQAPLGSGHPDEFHREISFLSTIVTAGSRPNAVTRWQQTRTAYRVIRVARRMRVLDDYRKHSTSKQLITYTTIGERESETGYRGMFEVPWESVTGYFISQYDVKYCHALQRELERVANVLLPPISAITKLQNFVHLQLLAKTDKFRQAQKSDRLQQLLDSHSLLGVELRPRDFRLIAGHLESCKVDVKSNISRIWASVETQSAVRYWLDRLSTKPEDLGGNAVFSLGYTSKLLDRPLYESSNGHLLCLTHRIPTEISQLLHAHWSVEFKERYFEARSRALEKVAVAALSASFRDATHASNAKYYLDRNHPEVEVDGIVLWRDVCLIIESKSAYFSPCTKQGSDSSATSDLLRTVGDGFYQASRLLKHLNEVGAVDLHSTEGTVRLRAKGLRRAYVVLPSADFLAGVPTFLRMLWANKILPQNSVPLIASVQDLALIADMLPDPLDLLAYLDYREEVLAHQEIYLADELEILGSFIGGHDVVGEKELYEFSVIGAEQLESHIQRLFLVMANRQEAYLSSWLQEGAAARYGGRPMPEPPQRHSPDTRRKLREMLDRRKDFVSFSLIAHLDSNFLDTVLADERVPQRGSPEINMKVPTGALLSHRNDKLRDVRRTAIARRMQGACRTVVYLQRTPTNDIVFTYAERGGLHLFCADQKAGLLGRSRVGDLGSWYTEFEQHRNSQVDDKVMAVLREAGVEQPIAKGIAIRHLHAPLLSLLEAGIDVRQAANALLGPMSRLAARRGSSVTELRLEAYQIRDVLELVRRGSLDNADLEDVLHEVELSPGRDVESTAADLGRLRETQPNEIYNAVTEILREQQQGDLSKPLRMTKKTRTHLAGELRRRNPGLSPSLMSRELDKQLGEQSESD